jgi:hypothetical protein
MKKDVKDFLAGYGPEVRKLAVKLRELVVEVAPTATEQLDVPAKIIGYGYGPRYEDSICAISPFKTYVNLNIYKGTELPDPAGLLEGTGKLHRHVKITTAEDVESRALLALLKAAVAATHARRAALAQRSSQH